MNLDPARHGTLKRAHDIALGLTHNLARSRARSIADLCDTAYAYTSTPALARARELAHGLAYELVYDLAHDRDPVCTLERVRKQAHELEQCLQGIVMQEKSAGGSHAVPERTLRGLVGLAVRVLPVRDRPRYAEEFRVELSEVPRRERWGYALRTLTRAWELRRVLTGTVRTPDAVGWCAE